MLGLVVVERDEVAISDLGKEFASASQDRRKAMAAEMLQRLEAVKGILTELAAGEGRADAASVAERLGEPGVDLAGLVAWGRLAGLWRYDSHSHAFLRPQ
jgi:hypothetical protein